MVLFPFTLVDPVGGRCSGAARPGGWGGRIRTSGCEIQSLVPYHLATPQCSSADSPERIVQMQLFDLFERALPGFRRGLRRGRRRHRRRRALERRPVLLQDALLDPAPRLLVERVGDVLEIAVLLAPRGHADE